MKIIQSVRFATAVLVAIGASLSAFAAEKTESSRPNRPAATEKASSGRSAKVDLNTADQAALEGLPGVGPQTAKAIVAARPFASVDDLADVPGIGPAKMQQLKGMVTVSTTRPASTASKEPAKARTAKKIDVNTADLETLETLPGVGPQTARAIVAARPFASVDDLERVPGIGPARLAALRDDVTVSRTRAPAATPRASSRTPEPRDRDLEPTGRTVPERRASTLPAVTTRSQGLTNLNTATREELEALPEIGPVKAQAIIEARPFSSIEDVMRVKGIKEGTFEVIKDKVTVGEPRRTR
jgi:competence protein ComEA